MSSYPSYVPQGVLLPEQPAASPWQYGLYSAAAMPPEDPAVRWQIGGAMWAPDTCVGGALWFGGMCQPPNVVPSWTLTVGSRPAGMTVTQPDAANRPFDVLVAPPTPAAGTVEQLIVNWGDGVQTAYPAPVPGTLVHTYRAVGMAYTLTTTYVYASSGAGTPQTVTLTFTGSGPPQTTKDAWGVTWQGALPVAVYNAVKCAPVGLTDAADRAGARLGFNEQRLVERALFYGEQGNRPSLASAMTTPITPLEASDPGLDLPYALGVLEQSAQNDTNTALVIHAPRSLAALASHNRLVFRDGNKLVTPLGNAWSFGAGYGFEGPDGITNPAQAWIYATGAVTVRRSDVVTNEVFSAPLNATLAVAERQVLVTAECTQQAAKVIFPPAPIGAAPLTPPQLP